MWLSSTPDSNEILLTTEDEEAAGLEAEEEEDGELSDVTKCLQRIPAATLTHSKTNSPPSYLAAWRDFSTYKEEEETPLPSTLFFAYPPLPKKKNRLSSTTCGEDFLKKFKE